MDLVVVVLVIAYTVRLCAHALAAAHQRRRA
jgi:hypothetical protein